MKIEYCRLNIEGILSIFKKKQSTSVPQHKLSDSTNLHSSFFNIQSGVNLWLNGYLSFNLSVAWSFSIFTPIVIADKIPIIITGTI